MRYVAASTLIVLGSLYPIILDSMKVNSKLPFHLPSMFLYSELFKFLTMIVCAAFAKCDTLVNLNNLCPAKNKTFQKHRRNYHPAFDVAKLCTNQQNFFFASQE